MVKRKRVYRYATKKQGFYLYMFCIYLACVVILGTIIMPFSFYAFQTILTFVKKDKELQDAYLLFAIIKRELQKAPWKQKDLKQLSTHEIVWASENENVDVGFLYSEKKASFFKIQGSYDKEKKVWRSKRQFLIAKNIAVFFAPIDQENTIINCKVTTDDFSFWYIVFSQNRIYMKNQ